MIFSLAKELPGQVIEQAAEVFWGSFSEKLGHALGDEETAKNFLTHTFDPNSIVLALADQEVLGVLAVSDWKHPILAHPWAGAKHTYGHLQGAWRLLLMLPLGVAPPRDTLYVEYVAVSPAARGRGVGSQLMERAEEIAEKRGLGKIALDVVDTNPRARELYERLGYEAVKTYRMGPLSKIYHFESSLLMVKDLKNAGPTVLPGQRTDNQDSNRELS